jgi:hypothetical protein
MIHDWGRILLLFKNWTFPLWIYLINHISTETLGDKATTSTLPKGTIGSVASLLAEALDLDLDRNQKLWNIVSSERYILHMQDAGGMLLINTTSATSGAGTHYPSGAPAFTPGFSGVCVTRSLLLYVCFVDHCLSFILFVLAIVLSVLLRYTDDDYPLGISKPFILLLIII